jgi:hypothetical protein
MNACFVWVSVVLCVSCVAVSPTVKEETSVQFLAPQHGVVFNQVGSICFQTGFRQIHLQYDYGLSYSSFSNIYAEVVDKLGIFGSDNDSELAIRKRVCEPAARVRGICPKGRAITESEARIRNTLYDLLDSVHQANDDNYNSWQAFPKGTNQSTSFPADKVSQDLQVIDNVLFGLISDPYGEQKDVLEVFSGNRTFSNSGNELVHQFLFLWNLLLAQQVRFQEIKMILQQLDKGFFPSELVSFTSLQLEFKTLFRNIVTEDELPLVLQLIERFPLTTVTQVGICKTETSPICKVNIITRIPTLNVSQQLMHVHAFPIAHEGYLRKLSWKQLQLAPQLFVPITERKKILDVDISFFSRCQSAAPLRNCSICDESSMFHLNSVTCLRNLYFDNSAENCSWTVPKPVSTLHQVSANKFVYIDETPGELLANCNSSSSLMELSPSSLVTLNPSCTYELHDDGNNLIKPVLDIWNLLIKGKAIIHNRNILDDINTVQGHFKDFGYIYIICFGSFFLLIFFYCCCVCLWKFNKYRNRRAQVSPSVRYTPIAVSDNQQIYIPAAPVRSRPQLRGPIIREVPSGIQITAA